MIITIDGPVASGKSTLACLLAHKLSYYYLYSGLLYRALAYVAVQYAHKRQDELVALSFHEIGLLINKITYTYSADGGVCINFDTNLITKELKTPEVDTWASLIATNSHARSALLLLQRAIANDYSLVADGRDCGTRVFPDADYKFFLIADVRVRAQRWQADQNAQGHRFTLSESMATIEDRDNRDRLRNIDPLKPACDALIIDNTGLTIDETLQLLLHYIQSPDNEDHHE